MYFGKVLLLLTLRERQHFINQVSKPKAAVVHANLSVSKTASKRNAKETQVSMPKVALIHVKNTLTLRHAKTHFWFGSQETACITSGLKIK